MDYWLDTKEPSPGHMKWRLSVKGSIDLTCSVAAKMGRLVTQLPTDASSAADWCEIKMVFPLPLP